MLDAEDGEDGGGVKSNATYGWLSPRVSLSRDDATNSIDGKGAAPAKGSEKMSEKLDLENDDASNIWLNVAETRLPEMVKTHRVSEVLSSGGDSQLMPSIVYQRQQFVRALLMYGGYAILPSNSPHLRKSGSRAVFIDPSSQHFSSTEGANNSEEGFPLLTESDEMKGSSTPMTAATIVPSPVLLWRFKVQVDQLDFVSR